MRRCALCPAKNSLVPIHGPRTTGGILFIGEAPGKDENRERVPFIGKTGDEVNAHYLPLAGLKRQDCTFTNAIKCLPISTSGKLDLKREADRKLLQCCADTHLNQEILEMQPRLLVPLGAFACTAVDPDINLEVQHGFPVATQWGITAFPMYHPAQGLHEPKKMLHLRSDWQRLALFLAERLRVPRDPFPRPDYAEVTDVAEIRELDPTIPLAADTESSRSQGPYCLTYSQRPGSGRLIRSTSTDCLAALQEKLDSWESVILFHHWLYDIKVTIEMGLRFPARRMRDTMVLAFHLGNVPQGLKALAWRKLGMEMDDFEDVVKPYSEEKVLDYYRYAQLQDWPKPDERVEQDEKTGLWKMKKPQGMNTKLKRFFTDFGKNPEKDVFGMWTDNWVEEQPMLEAVCGPWPGMDIAHVPFERVLHYACRDADATVRLWPLLSAMRRRVRKYPQELWDAA